MFWNKKITNLGPFRIHTGNKMERYRADTFRTKEPETLRWVKTFQPNSIFIDCGANIGLYSLYAGIGIPTLRVYAIEPLQANYARLVANLELNECHNITLIHGALGKKTGIEKFYPKSTQAGDSGGQLYEAKDEYKKMFIPPCENNVLTFTFDQMTEWLPPNRDVYLKIDVDGHENAVLAGIDAYGRRLAGVLVEINKDVTDIRQVDALMACFDLVPDGRINEVRPHSSERRGGNPINRVYTRVK